MIQLDIQPYCSECRDLNPVVKYPETKIFSNGDVIFGGTLIQCIYAKRCENIKRYLTRQIENFTDSQSTKEDLTDSRINHSKED